MEEEKKVARKRTEGGIHNEYSDCLFCIYTARTYGNLSCIGALVVCHANATASGTRIARHCVTATVYMFKRRQPRFLRIETAVMFYFSIL